MVDYLAEIEEVKAEIEELTYQLENAEDEEQISMIEIELDSKEEELAILNDNYEDYKYSKGNMWSYNGINQRDFI